MFLQVRSVVGRDLWHCLQRVWHLRVRQILAEPQAQCASGARPVHLQAATLDTAILGSLTEPVASHPSTQAPLHGASANGCGVRQHRHRCTKQTPMGACSTHAPCPPPSTFATLYYASFSPPSGRIIRSMQAEASGYPSCLPIYPLPILGASTAKCLQTPAARTFCVTPARICAAISYAGVSACVCASLHCNVVCT